MLYTEMITSKVILYEDRNKILDFIPIGNLTLQIAGCHKIKWLKQLK